MYFKPSARIAQGAAAVILAGSLIAGAAWPGAGAAELPAEPEAVGVLVIPARLTAEEREIWRYVCQMDNERVLAQRLARMEAAKAEAQPEGGPAEIVEAEPERVYLGRYKITGYDTCSRCCGNSNGVTASGETATVGRTCAGPKSLPFGTRIWIDGLGERVVEDRGGAVNGQHIDVLCADHPECYSITGYYDVWKVAG